MTNKRLHSLPVALVVRRVARVATLGLVVGWSSATRAAGPQPQVEQELEQAEQALRDLAYDAANDLAARLVQEHGLTHDELVRSYRVLAFTDAILGKESAAREAFSQLLVYDPNYRGDANLSPKVRAPLMEAQGALRSQAVQPGLDVTVTLRPAEGGTIRVTTRDPTGIAKHATVSYRWGTEAPFASAPVAIGKGATTDVPPPPQGTTRLDYYVQVTDDRDDVVFESGNASAPKSATVDLSASAEPLGGRGVTPTEPTSHRSSLFASPIFWTVTGVVLGGVVTGVYFAARPGNKTIESPGVPSPATGATLTPILQCGPAGHSCN